MAKPLPSIKHHLSNHLPLNDNSYQTVTSCDIANGERWPVNEEQPLSVMESNDCLGLRVYCNFHIFMDNSSNYSSSIQLSRNLAAYHDIGSNNGTTDDKMSDLTWRKLFLDWKIEISVPLYFWFFQQGPPRSQFAHSPFYNLSDCCIGFQARWTLSYSQKVYQIIIELLISRAHSDFEYLKFREFFLNLI